MTNPLGTGVDIGQDTTGVKKTLSSNYLWELRDIGRDIERDISKTKKTLLIRCLWKLRDIGQDTFSKPKNFWICPAPTSSISLSAPVPSSLVHQFETPAPESKHSINLYDFHPVRSSSSLLSQPEPNSLVHQFPMLSAPVRLTKKFQAGHRAGHFHPHPTPKIPERDIISPLKMSCSSAKAYKTSKL